MSVDFVGCFDRGALISDDRGPGGGGGGGGSGQYDYISTPCAKKIKEYKIVISSTPFNLSEEVNAEISYGWQPFGVILYNGTNIMQCMVKYK